ncbi:hypothetical protein BH09BAC5_BH09BAC5_04100 [soil metagenome]
MKNNFLFAVLIFFTTTATAQTDTTSKFYIGMAKQVAIVDTAFTPPTMQKLYNSFERIANAEKGEWLPDYYMAYCLVMQAYQVDKSMVDDMCDHANLLLDRADSLKGDASEIFVLRSMVCSARIMVDPRTRGAKFGKMASVFLDSAEIHNANNPRIELNRGQGLYYTPPMFGGGKNKAKPHFEVAIKKYDASAPKSFIDPHWGRFRAQQLLDDCNK